MKNANQVTTQIKQQQLAVDSGYGTLPARKEALQADQGQFEAFLNQSQTQRFQEKFLELDQQNAVQKKEKMDTTGMSKEQIKAAIIKKVENMTVDSITRQLLRENKLALTEEEKEYRRLQEKTFLIRKGARIDKQKYMNMKELTKMRRQEREQQAARDKALREDGMIVIKNGKSHTLRDGFNVSERDLTAKKVNWQVAEKARQYADRRGYEAKNEGMAGKFENGQLDISKLRKKIEFQRRK